MIGIYNYTGIYRDPWIYNSLSYNGDWCIDLRPTQVRITISGTTDYVEIYDESAILVGGGKETILSDGSNTIDVNLQGNEIQRIVINPIDDYTKIINIEFYEDGEWTSYFSPDHWMIIQEPYMRWE